MRDRRFNAHIFPNHASHSLSQIALSLSIVSTAKKRKIDFDSRTSLLVVLVYNWRQKQPRLWNNTETKLNIMHGDRYTELKSTTDREKKKPTHTVSRNVQISSWFALYSWYVAQTWYFREGSHSHHSYSRLSWHENGGQHVNLCACNFHSCIPKEFSHSLYV